ncbi:hypothetical protein DBB34_18720, partial [Sphaerisporangium cinnabarinum]
MRVRTRWRRIASRSARRSAMPCETTPVGAVDAPRGTDVVAPAPRPPPRAAGGRPAAGRPPDERTSSELGAATRRTGRVGVSSTGARRAL